MCRLQSLAATQVHVYAARKAWVEAAYRPHDVDALEAVRRILFEDRRVLHRVLVRTRRSVYIANAAVPWRRRVRVVVRDLPALNHHVVRQHATDRLGEPAADRLIRHLERLPRLGVTRTDLGA